MDKLDPKKAALLVMDYQSGIVDRVGDKKDALLANAAKLIDAARKAHVRVVYVVVHFRAGHPEVSPNNMSFSVVKGSNMFIAGTPGTEIHPAVAPKDDEVVVVKHRVSAFAGTELDLVLRANGVDTLVLAGIATSGVILSTTRHAADADYKMLVVEDACADPDAEVHRVLFEKILSRQAVVVKTADALAALGG